MPDTLAERKTQEERRLSAEFQALLGHYLDLGKTEAQHQSRAQEIEELIHELSKKYRAAARGCPPGFKQCADGGCVPRSRSCNILKRPSKPA